MKTIRQLIDELKQYNPEYLVYAYEGEFTGLVVLDQEKKQVSRIDVDYEPEGFRC